MSTTSRRLDSLVEGLTDEQLDAVTTTASPLCLVAGAGSGKTRVLTRRIAWQAASGNIDPRRVLAVTFTRRAAGELRGRLRRLGLRDAVAAGTFHSIALAQLKRHWEARGTRPPELLERRTALVGSIVGRADRTTVVEIASEIGWARARLVAADRYVDAAGEAGRRTSTRLDRIAKVYADYESLKRKRRVIDFDDLLALCHTTLERNPEFRAAQRWRHRHLLVDEFQDVNPLQFALLKTWLGDESSLLVVGDPDQAIYGWNGAEPDLLREIDRYLPGIAVLHLRTNFRSTPEILRAAGQVLDREAQPAVRPAGPDPTVTAVASDDDEATHVARRVRDLHPPGSRWRDQAILARTNAQLPAIKQALDRAGIPVRARSDLDPRHHPAIAQVLDDHHPSRRLDAFVADVRTTRPELGLSEADDAMLDAVFAVAADCLALDLDATVADLTAALRTDDRPAEHRDAVELATFHAAKGLEWPIVHLIGIEKGLVPIVQARTPAARAEEQRLLHVALTRAEREVHLTWARRRRFGERVDDRSPSPYLERLTSEQPEPIPPPLDELAELRARFGPGDVIDLTDTARAADLRAALESWRTESARRAKVPPAAVLTDQTLEAIVEQRPGPDGLDDLPGFGPSLRRRFGDEVLKIVADTER